MTSFVGLFDVRCGKQKSFSSEQLEWSCCVLRRKEVEEQVLGRVSV